MPSPKSGKAGSAVTPAAPAAPAEADVADPGKIEEIKARQREAREGKYGSQKATPFKPAKTADQKQEKKSWIEIKLVDDAGNPVPGERVEVTLSDKTVWSGTLDGNGFARVEGIPPGQCKVVFPEHDKSCWKSK